MVHDVTWDFIDAKKYICLYTTCLIWFMLTVFVIFFYVILFAYVMLGLFLYVTFISVIERIPRLNKCSFFTFRKRSSSIVLPNKQIWTPVCVILVSLDICGSLQGFCIKRLLKQNILTFYLIYCLWSAALSVSQTQFITQRNIRNLNRYNNIRLLIILWGYSGNFGIWFPSTVPCRSLNLLSRVATP